MHGSILRRPARASSALVVASLVSSLAVAQSTNPFQALKDAATQAVQAIKAKETQQTQPAQQPAPAQPAQSPPAAAAAAPWTPPADTPSAPVGPLDPAKLPDVAGVHIGAASAEVTPILQKLHPGAPIQPQGNQQGLPIGVRQTVGTANPLSGDLMYVSFTYVPGKQQSVFAVYRAVQYGQPIAKQNLLDALRQKYGRETLADRAGNQGPTTNDPEIREMYWLIDEQGHVVHPGNPDAGHLPYGCQGDMGETDAGTLYIEMIRTYVRGQPLPPATFCDSVIVLHVNLEASNGGNIPLVGVTHTAMLDRALMRRSEIAVGDWQRAQALKKQQDEQTKANQAKPNL
jgi:hypothetical protein